MNNNAYKKIDSIERLLENFWRIFPNIETTVLKNKVIKPVLENSVEFCELIKKRIINVKTFTEGGFGAVGNLSINEDEPNQPLMAIIVSLNTETKTFVPFSTPIIIKVFFTARPNWLIQGTTLYISDPFSELIFGSMLGHLYDLGVCPFFTKYFGAYVCDALQTVTGKSSTQVITEKASVELLYLLDRGKGIAVTHPRVIMNIIFQYVYALFIMKYFYGMAHYDTQYRNLMVTIINKVSSLDANPESNINKLFKKYKPVDYIYQGQDLSSTEYILFDTSSVIPDSYICIKNTGFLLKIIDYGACSANLNLSKSDIYNRNLSIATSIDDLKKLGADIAYSKGKKDFSYLNTLDLQYTLVNMYEHLTKGLDKVSHTPYDDPTAKITNEKIIRYLNYFTEKFYNDTNLKISTFLENNPRLQIRKERGPRTTSPIWNWISFVRDAGISKQTFNKPERLLQGLLNVCGEFNYTNASIRGKPSKVYFLEEPLVGEKYIILSNHVSEFANSLNIFSTIATESRKLNYCRTKVECILLADSVDKHSLDNVLSKRLYNPLSVEFVTALKNKTYIDFSKIKPVAINGLFYYFQFQLNPAVFKIDINIDIIFFHVYAVSPSSKKVIDFGVDLWEGMKRNVIGSTGIGLTCGYFKEQPTSTPLTIPIGFFYSNKLISNGTYIQFPIPSVQAAIYCSNNTVHINQYASFLAKHKIIQEEINGVTINNIAMATPSSPELNKIGTVPVKRNGALITDDDYEWAFCSGPILIWDSKPVPIQNDLPNRYHVYNTQNILGITISGDLIIILCEGNGYDSPGLTVTEVSKLIYVFGLTKAVFLGRGFNTNMLTKNCLGPPRCDPVYILNNPLKKKTGISLYAF